VDVKVDLTIKVRNAADAPIAGANVTVKVLDSRREGECDGQGNFAGGNPSIPFHVFITHPVYLSEEVEVIPPPKEPLFIGTTQFVVLRSLG
jgi:hypothetical protein